MPAAAGGYVIKDASVLIGTAPGVQYANQLDTATLTPEQATQTKKTLVPDGTLQDVDSATWSVSLAGIQDYVAGQGLARYLTDNAGTSTTLELTPKNGGVKATVTVVCKAVPFGGETGKWAEFSIELPVIGQPVFA